MKFNSGSAGFQNPTPGTHPALCTKVIDLGTQPTSYQGKPGTPQRKLRLFWELAEKMADGRPLIAVKKYTASLNEKATLRKDIETWTGTKLTAAQIEKFNPKILLGKGCLLSLVENGEFVNVNAVMKLPAGTAAPAAFGEMVYFDLDAFDPAVFEAFSESTKKLIESSPEYRALGHADAPDQPPTTPDDIPF